LEEEEEEDDDEDEEAPQAAVPRTATRSKTKLLKKSQIISIKMIFSPREVDSM